MWGCSLPLPDEKRLRERWYMEAGYDAEGQAIALRQADREATPAEGVTEIALVEDRTRIVYLGNGAVARTAYGEHGLPERTDYTWKRALNSETYEYDSAGRLVGIDESDGLWFVTPDSERYDPGGRLTVEYDELGVERILHESGAAVWERPELPWPKQLDAGVELIAAACIEATRAACAQHEVAPGTEVFALCLFYEPQGGLHPILSFGLESDRREWRAAGVTGAALAANLLYPSANHEGLNMIDADIIDDDLDQRLLRAACIQQTADPYRAVLGPVAARLARTKWPPLLRPTPTSSSSSPNTTKGSPRRSNRFASTTRQTKWPAGTHRGRPTLPAPMTSSTASDRECHVRWSGASLKRAPQS
jgi:hypothetical protein